MKKILFLFLFISACFAQQVRIVGLDTSGDNKRIKSDTENTTITVASLNVTYWGE